MNLKNNRLCCLFLRITALRSCRILPAGEVLPSISFSLILYSGTKKCTKFKKIFVHFFSLQILSEKLFNYWGSIIPVFINCESLSQLPHYLYLPDLHSNRCADQVVPSTLNPPSFVRPRTYHAVPKKNNSC